MNSPDPAANDPYLLEAITLFRDATRVPAIIAAVVEADGGLRNAVVGYRQRGGTDPATIGDQWHIGSCGKAMTAAVYARLVESGLAQWDTPVADLFADLASDIDPGWQEPTIDDLLRCRAGVAPDPTRAAMKVSWDSTSPPSEQRTDAVLAALARAPKGTGEFTYSNLGYTVAGAAIDRLAGLPYEEALAAYVTEPLGITSLGFGAPPHVCGHKSKLAVGSVSVGRGKPALPADARSDNPPQITPAGRMHLSITDWAKFVRVFMTQGQPLLTPGSVEHLLRPPADEPEAMAMGWSPAKSDELSYGAQGSNTMWSATALFDSDMQRAALVITNDGRTHALQRSAFLAMSLL